MDKIHEVQEVKYLSREVELFEEFNRLEYPVRGYAEGTTFPENTRGTITDIQNGEFLSTIPSLQRLAVVLDGDHIMDFDHKIFSLPTGKVVQEVKELSEFRDRYTEVLAYTKLPGAKSYCVYIEEEEPGAFVSEVFDPHLVVKKVIAHHPETNRIQVWSWSSRTLTKDYEFTFQESPTVLEVIPIPRGSGIPSEFLVVVNLQSSFVIFDVEKKVRMRFFDPNESGARIFPLPNGHICSSWTSDEVTYLEELSVTPKTPKVLEGKKELGGRNSGSKVGRKRVCFL